MPWINRILVPIDLTAHSLSALRYAIFLGEHNGATLHIVHVCDSLPAETESENSDDTVLSLSRQRLKKQVQDLLAHFSSDIARHAQIHVVAGDTASAILRQAREQHVDLIVMGRNGDTPQSGNITAAVAEHAACGVVPVHEAATNAAGLRLLAPDETEQHATDLASHATNSSVLNIRRPSESHRPVFH